MFKTHLSIWITLFSLFTASFAQNKKAPNIVFVFSDDHAEKAISAYGSKINQTPNIDRIAKKGITFMNSFCANSICGPSRASILTSKHSHLNGFLSNSGRHFNGAQWTFPKALQKAGYQTAVIGKWHLGSKPTGFDHWEVLPGQGYYYAPVFKHPDGERKYTGYVSDIITDLSLDWLKNRKDKDKPFMLMCQHKAPHRNFSPAIKYLTKYDDGDIPEPPTLFDSYENRHPSLKKHEMGIESHFFYDYDLKVRDHGNKWERGLKNYHYDRMTPEEQKGWDAAYEPKNKAFKAANLKGKDLIRWKYQRYIKDYLRCIDSVDESVGRLLDYLEKTGEIDNTIFIYSSDQGFYLGEHGWYDKRWMYEESLRMPFIISGPGIAKPGSKRYEMIQNIDYAPTFLELAGVEIPKSETQGTSLVPLLKDQKKDWRKSIYYHYFESGFHGVPRHEGVRNERYKLMYFHASKDYNLYDLKLDPQEMKSLHNDSKYANILKDMKEEMERLKLKYQYKDPVKKKKKKKKA